MENNKIETKLNEFGERVVILSVDGNRRIFERKHMVNVKICSFTHELIVVGSKYNLMRYSLGYLPDPGKVMDVIQGIEHSYEWPKDDEHQRFVYEIHACLIYQVIKSYRERMRTWEKGNDERHVRDYLETSRDLIDQKVQKYIEQLDD